MNYITLDELMPEHETQLSLYYQAGIADNAVIYPKVVRCLQEVGIKILPTKEAVIPVDGGVGTLPDDFVLPVYMYACHVVNHKTQQVHGLHSYEKRFCHIEPCMTENSYNHDEFGRYKNIYVFEHENVEIVKQRELTLGQHFKCCKNTFKQNYHDVEINNGQLLCNFREGIVYLEYKASIFNDNILIPDYPEIINWILAEMEVVILRTMLMNTTQDVAQRFQLAKQELHILKENARAFWKRNSF